MAGTDTKPATQPNPRRLSREAWLEIGLSVAGDPAITAITIDDVCRKAGKTIGGFYAHFGGMDDFLLALANLWRERFTLDLFRSTRMALPPAMRLDLLNYLAIHLDGGVEQGIRRLSAREAAVAEIVHTVDRARTDYLAELYEASGRYTQRQARALARIEYAAFVGMQQTETGASAEDLLALYGEFLQLTGRAEAK